MHKFSQAGEIKCLKNGRIEGELSKKQFPFFIKREDGMLVISCYNWIVYQEKFKMDNNYTEMFRRNKNINTGVAKLIKDNTTF